jgi:DNA-binding NarL/FixJ family response regulator
MATAFNQPLVCPVLIGRRHDLTTLRLLIERAKSSQGQVALLSGEAGIGKSRLVAEIKTESVAHDFRLWQGSCFPTDHAIPYAPLLDLLRSYFSGHSSTLHATEVKQVAQAFLPLLPDVGQVLADTPPPPPLAPLDPEQEKRRRFEILAHFFTFQADTHPLLLVVEDLHWSDETSLEFLHYLARRCSAHRLLLLLTYRSDEVYPSLRHFLAHLDRERLAQEVSLTRLTREEVEAMLRAIFALPRSARLELLDPMYTLTEGNPFFVEEALKSLLATGEIVYANGRWERKPLGELHIPRSVQDAVQQRAGQLSESSRHVLILAAVAGRRFDFGLLQALTKQDEDQLLTLIKELMAAQLVIEESVEQFAFRHALTRQAVYADLLVRERKVLHRRIAETMERLYGPSSDDHLADLAYHFYEAGAWEKTVAYGQRAGEQAQAMYTPRAAIEQVTRALDAAHHLERDVPPKLYQVRGLAYETLGEFEAALSDYELAREVAHTLHDRVNEWQSLIDLGSLWAKRDYQRAGEWFQCALELAQHLADPTLHAHTLNHMGNRFTYIAQPREALRCHQEALSIFQRLNDQHGIAETLNYLGWLSYTSGDLIEGKTSYEQAVALLQELDDRQRLVSSLVILMLCEGTNYQNDLLVPAAASLAESLGHGEVGLQLARGIGHRSLEAYALIYMGGCLGPHGEYARALESLRVGLTIVEEAEHRLWMIEANWILGALYLDLLAPSLAQQHLEQALALAHEMSSPAWVRMVTGLLASVCIQQHDLARAESVLGTLLSPQTRRMGQRLAWYARAHLALARRDPGLALDITDQLIAGAANMSNEGVIPRLWKLRGEALAALHRTAEAETMLRAAQEAAQAQGLRPLLWRICIALGNLKQTQARQEEAKQAFATARTIIEELAANVPDEHVREQFLRQAMAMLPHVRPLSAAHAAKGPFGGLTTREREVAVLIAQGKANREIADLLVVGNRTVEAHVSGILSKLGFTSRAQIAVWAHEKGLVPTKE